MAYQSAYPLIIKSSQPYITLTTLADLTSSSLDTTNGYSIHINNKTVKFTPESEPFTHNYILSINKIYTSSKLTYLIDMILDK